MLVPGDQNKRRAMLRFDASLPSEPSVATELPVLCRHSCDDVLTEKFRFT
jgi:hypothetical protein